MALVKRSIATGLFGTAGTWSDYDSASANDSEAVSTSVTTGNLDSSTFVPANVAINAIAVKLAAIAASPTGTFTISFRNNTSPGSRDFSITVNIIDLPNIGAASTPGKWIVFKNGSAVTPNGTDSYVIRVTRSGGSTSLNLYASSANNWARLVFQSAASGAAPAVNDELVIAGELTGAGTSNSWTVTFDNTASTNWGSAVGNEAIVVCWKGTLTCQTNNSAYIMNLLGRLEVGSGTLNIGTSGTPMPSGASFNLTFQNAGNVDCGLEIRALATVNLYGNTLTYVQTKLAADAAAAATALTTVDSTGWLNGDSIALASTTRTASECESKALGANASGTSIGTIAALTNAHSGTNNANGDIRGELGNLTRNLKIQGNSSTLGAYVNINATAVVTWRYAEFTKIGSGTSSKRGVDVATTTGTFDCQFCSGHDCTVASSRLCNVSSASGSGITFSSNVTYNIANNHFVNVATSGSQTVSGNLAILVNDSAQAAFVFSDVGSVYTNNTAVGASSAGQGPGIFLSENAAISGTFSGNVAHACSGAGISITLGFNGTLSSLTCWRNNGSLATTVNGGLNISGIHGGLVISTFTCFGNGIMNVFCTATGVLLTGGTIDAGATLASTIGIQNGTTPSLITLDSCTFGSTNTHSSGDVFQQNTTANLAVGFMQWIMNNCLLSSSTEVQFNTNVPVGAFIASQKHDQTVGNHKTWMPEGVSSLDSAIYDVTPSVRLTPSISAVTASKMSHAPLGRGWLVPVANGNAVTFTAKVRKSVAGDGTAYNGTAPRLMVRKNVALGISADMVLATDGGAGSASATWGSGGTAEILTGTTAAVTDDGVLEFYVDCDGTLGWVNVDTVQVTKGGAFGFGGMDYWFNGLPQVGMGYAGAVIGGDFIRALAEVQ